MALGWLLVLIGGFWGLRGPRKGGLGRRDSLVERSLLADMEIESLEPNTTSCPLWPASKGAGKPFESGVWMLEQLARNCVSTTHSSRFPADGGRDV